MRNVLTIVDSFVHNDRVENKLSNCVTKLKQRNHDIMLISNTIVNPKILQKVNFYFYDQRNQLFQENYDNYTKTVFWKQFGNFIVYDIVLGLQRHGLSVVINLFNAIHIAKSLGYEYFQRFEVDDLMGPKSLDFVDSVPDLCTKSNSLGLFYFNERDNQKESDVSFHYFYCEINYFLERVRRITCEKDYISYLQTHQKNKDFMIVERYLYENFKSMGSTKLLKRSGTIDIQKDFPDTVWNSETTPSNIESKFNGCTTKIYKRKVHDQLADGFIIFSYNHIPVVRDRIILIQKKDGVESVVHKFTEANQWYYSVVDDVQKIQVLEDKKLLFEEENKNIESYINFV